MHWNVLVLFLTPENRAIPNVFLRSIKSYCGGRIRFCIDFLAKINSQT